MEMVAARSIIPATRKKYLQEGLELVALLVMPLLTFLGLPRALPDSEGAMF